MILALFSGLSKIGVIVIFDFEGLKNTEKWVTGLFV